MSYAEGTSVSVEKSKAEIERTLTKYGADKFFYGWDGDAAVIGFRANALMVQFKLPLPDPNDDRFKATPGGRRRRSADQAYAAWEAECRRAWRALALVIKARLEAVESGIESFEEAFLSHIMVGNNETVGDRVIPEVKEFYVSGKPPMLALPSSTE